MQDMENLLKKITEAMDEFKVDAKKRFDGNMAAGVRSRKKSLELEKMFKAWRKASLPDSVVEG